MLTAVVTASAYTPVSTLLYRISEPRYLCPISTGSHAIRIRNDACGSGTFGASRSGNRRHTGLDIAAAVGTPVRAAKSGVAFCGKVPTGYGKYVMIYHPDGAQTVYAHLSHYAVFSTKKVRRGEVIGYVGTSGNARDGRMQPHLHFEIREDGRYLNPATRIST